MKGIPRIVRRAATVHHGRQRVVGLTMFKYAGSVRYPSLPMPVRTFEFSSVDGRRFVKPTDRWVNLRVDHNSTVTLISELGDRQASVDFRFTANYHASEAVVGLIQIEGNLLWEGDARTLVKSWSSGGQMPPEVAQEIHTVIMSNCIPEAVILARDLRLPPPVPIPQVNVPQQPAKPGKGRSPEIA